MQMKLVRVRDSKFGPALVIETSQRCGGYILGFRVDPAEQLQTIFQEVQSLHTVFSKTPIFGVDFATEEKAPPLAELTQKATQDDVEFVDTEASDSIAAYYAEGNKRADHEVVLSPELGLAIERLPEGLTAKALWQMV